MFASLIDKIAPVPEAGKAVAGVIDGASLRAALSEAEGSVEELRIMSWAIRDMLLAQEDFYYGMQEELANKQAAMAHSLIIFGYFDDTEFIGERLKGLGVSGSMSKPVPRDILDVMDSGFLLDEARFADERLRFRQLDLSLAALLDSHFTYKQRWSPSVTWSVRDAKGVASERFRDQGNQ